MKEINGESGGRPLFNEDWERLQDNIDAQHAQFLDKEPFIISGVNITKDSGTLNTYSFSEGYVWVGGKIRKFSGANSVTIPNQGYLEIIETDISSVYKDGATRSIYTDYNCIITNSGDTNPNNHLLVINNGEIFENVIRYDDLFEYVSTSQTSGTQIIKSDVKIENKDLVVTGIVGATNFVGTGGLFIGQNSITQTTISASNLDADNVDISGDMTVNGDAAFSKDVSITDPSDATTPDLSVSGNITAGGYIEGNSFRAEEAATDTIKSNGEIGDNHVVNGSIRDSSITVNKLSGSDTEDLLRSVSTDKIKDEAITSAKIALLGVEEFNIQNGAVTENKINDGVVTENKLRGHSSNDLLRSVSTDKIKDLAITTSKINLDAINRYHIYDGEIIEAALGTSSVTESKLSGSTTNDSLRAVSTSKIKDEAVTLAKLESDLQYYIQPKTTHLSDDYRHYNYGSDGTGGFTYRFPIHGVPQTQVRVRALRRWSDGNLQSSVSSSSTNPTETSPIYTITGQNNTYVNVYLTLQGHGGGKDDIIEYECEELTSSGWKVFDKALSQHRWL